MITVKNYKKDVESYKVAIPDALKSGNEMMLKYQEIVESGNTKVELEQKDVVDRYVSLLNSYLVRNGFVFKRNQTDSIQKFKVGDEVIYSKTKMKVVEVNYGGDAKTYLLIPLTGYPINAIAREAQMELIATSSKTTDNKAQQTNALKHKFKVGQHVMYQELDWIVEKLPINDENIYILKSTDSSNKSRANAREHLIKPMIFTKPKSSSEIYDEHQSRKKEPKAVKTTTKKEVKTPSNKVEKIPLEVSIFSQYVKFDNKDVDVAKVEALIRRIKKGISEGEIKKNTPYKTEFNAMASDVVKTLNSTPSNKFTIAYEVPAKLLAELKEITSDIGLLSSVVLIKKFLTEYGRENNDKIKKLIALTAKKIASGEVPKNDSHIKELRELKKYSEDYLESGQWKISQEQLNGFGSIGGLGNISMIQPKSTVIAPNKVMDTAEFVKSIFVQMPFRGKWKTFFGCPTPPFRAMFWGMPGNGKSTLALQFAHYVASDMDKKSLYVANEEGLGATLKEKVERLKITHPNLFLTEELPSKLSGYDFLFIDSADHAMLEPEDVNEISKKNPNLSIITVNQCTKDGSFRGSNVWEHDVDISVKCTKGIAENVKNRFGGTGQFKCF